MYLSLSLFQLINGGGDYNVGRKLNYIVIEKMFQKFVVFRLVMFDEIFFVVEFITDSLS